MTTKRPVWNWVYVSLRVRSAWQALAGALLKKLLPYLYAVGDGKRFPGPAVRDPSAAAKRIYMLPFDSSHMFCSNCKCAIPTHDVLSALRPNGFGQWFWAEDMDGNQFLVRETDYNPSVMRMSSPIPGKKWQELPVASARPPKTTV